MWMLLVVQGLCLLLLGKITVSAYARCSCRREDWSCMYVRECNYSSRLPCLSQSDFDGVRSVHKVKGVSTLSLCSLDVRFSKCVVSLLSSNHATLGLLTVEL